MKVFNFSWMALLPLTLATPFANASEVDELAAGLTLFASRVVTCRVADKSGITRNYLYTTMTRHTWGETHALFFFLGTSKQSPVDEYHFQLDLSGIPTPPGTVPGNVLTVDRGVDKITYNYRSALGLYASHLTVEGPKMNLSTYQSFGAHGNVSTWCDTL